MELKSYQRLVIENLESFLDYIQKTDRIDKAFNQFWEDKWGPYEPLTKKGMAPYKNNIPNVPHVCIKVPTAGGKTFIACNALQSIFSAYDEKLPKAVVWLVPWSNLLDQTISNLSNPDHPYRQKLNSLFNHRVEIYSKTELQQGSNFNPTVVNDQLSIFVMSFASLRARKKEDRKAYQENGQLAAFADQYTDRTQLLDDIDDTALINVIRSLQPVVIVDESHNAESDLSIDMLNNLNPSFILDLTATPKNNSNIISYVPAIELKKEHMVKLPVIVYNHHDKTEVITSALHLQKKLENLAIQQEKAGGKYIRPIVLFQAQPRTNEDNTTFDKLKQQLLKVGIPEEQIKIKTAEKDELKGIDLNSKDCQVRFIITINALKEGWDCPFAYILASLADKSSAVDVEQILGRVLRQPYVSKHATPLLNVSYVLTASAKFNETLEKIVNGLQNAGFSERDYRQSDKMPEEVKKEAIQQTMEQFLFPEQTEQEDEIEIERIILPEENDSAEDSESTIDQIISMAETENEAMESEIQRSLKSNPETTLLSEMAEKANYYRMLDSKKEQAQNIRLHQFMIKANLNTIFGIEELPLNQESLLTNFQLSNEDIKIDFDQISSDLYKVDLEEGNQNQYTPKFRKIEDPNFKDPMIDMILASPKSNQIKTVSAQLMHLIGNMYPIPDQEIRKYITRIIESLNAEQIHDVLIRKLSYTEKIKAKIKSHADTYAEQRFNDLLKTNQIYHLPVWRFPEVIIPGRFGPSIANSLYEKEAAMDSNFETSVIMDIASLPNISFWHRNLGRGKGFAINGYKSNHYPDFIVVTNSGNIILLETKGDDRDNPDSAAKRRLGEKWANIGGADYHYFMVYDTISPEGAYNRNKAKELISKL
ncbi:MAG: DEAD/DEAH box helicase family protein [Cytophagales bacterium]|nr:DEAD/DEAH box helicase family protein [Cytophagales bacterium]